MATLETTLIGPHIRFEADVTFAITGAEFRLTLNNTPIEMNTPVSARPGAILEFRERLRGARAYVGVAGGIEVPKVLGSRSTHALTAMGGLEGRALKAGDVLRIAPVTGARGEGQGAMAITPRPLPLAAVIAKLRAVPADARLFAHVTSQRFRISPQSNRMGYRLEGTPVVDAPTGELISMAVPTGTIQIPPTGQPILLMHDHATTGGYAIGGTVISADLPLAGQLAPGDWVEFETCSIAEARTALREREAMLGAA